jgi:Cu(I)/Ag(I) efflux system membrane fusion protein
MKKAILTLLLVAASAAGGYFFASQSHAPSAPSGESAGRKVLFYQSSMHPWIKSDKPGNCTICGMKLTPVLEGDQPKTVEANVVQLSSNAITVLNVQTATITRRALTNTIRASGVVEDDDTRHRVISAYVAGRIDTLHVNFIGAEVAEGSPLATFYSPDLLAAEREYVTLHTNRLEHHVMADAAALRLKRLGLTDAQIAALPKKPDSAQQSEIVAPMTGTLITRFVYPGQYVAEGEKLFEIADFSKMWLQLNIYERDLASIRVGQIAKVTAPALAGRELSGRVTFINPTIDEATRSALVRVELENPPVDVEGVSRRLLSHRLYAEAEIQTQAPEVIAVPRSAVLNPGGRPVVYVELGGGGYEQRAVKLGRRGDDFWEVIEGLEPDEKVVTQGNLMIDSQAQLTHGGAHPGHAHGHEHAPAAEGVAP